MKKLYIFILISIAAILTVIFLFPKEISDSHYVILQSYGYVYHEDKQAEIDIYTKLKKSLIEDVSNNEYYFTLDNRTSKLENVSVRKSRMGDYYVYTISFDLPIYSKNIKSNDTKLSVIGNKTLSFSLGSFSIIYEPKSEPSYESLYMSYSYIDNSLMLSGINIILDDLYQKISMVSVNGFAYSDFNNIVFGSNFNNEVDIKSILPNYQYNTISYASIDIKSNKCFIPIGYYDLLPIKHGYIIIILDEVEYIINDIDFIFNNLDIDEYINYLSEGIYA